VHTIQTATAPPQGGAVVTELNNYQELAVLIAPRRLLLALLARALSAATLLLSAALPAVLPGLLLLLARFRVVLLVRVLLVGIGHF
jgi:hypothetical protein